MRPPWSRATTATITEGGGNGPQGPQYRVKTYSLVGDGWADVYQYTYDSEGRVTHIYREEGKDYTLVYDGSKITMTNSGNRYAEMELGANGYVAKMTDEWDDVREYAYDAKGHMTQIKKNGEVVSEIAWEQECLVTWTRTRDGELQTKNHTYTGMPNTNRIFNIHSEASDPSRWLYETGLFGKPSVYLCESSKWAHSETASVYTYDTDDNGCVVKENKNYGGDMEYFEYTWEKIE
ncbi:DUF4595 domain-containing protein [uncultured Alistipes sp.]|uniref:DUF4595 domain-containing protein n=1 Tax=uncultured Alistipes sp. TaxID=538949 RepID=UPI002670818F|nr:DUF4595 domain-containing protein [uncultured Alistipes sp.]